MMVFVFCFWSSCQLTSCTAWWTEVRLFKLLSCEAQSTLDPLWTWSSTWRYDEEWIDWSAWQLQSMPLIGKQCWFQSMATANPASFNVLWGTCQPLDRGWQVGALASASFFVTWGAVQGDRRALPGPEAGFEGTLLLLLLARQAGLELVVPPFGQGCACILWEAWPRQELYSRKDLPSWPGSLIKKGLFLVKTCVHR